MTIKRTVGSSFGQELAVGLRCDIKYGSTRSTATGLTSRLPISHFNQLLLLYLMPMNSKWTDKRFLAIGAQVTSTGSKVIVAMAPVYYSKLKRVGGVTIDRKVTFVMAGITSQWRLRSGVQ